MPTCGLALAESERFLPGLMDDLEASLAKHGLQEEEITIRSTGCPNGCARPFIAEIGLVGRGPERYHLYLGAAFDGSRLSKLYREDASPPRWSRRWIRSSPNSRRPSRPGSISAIT